VKIPTASSGEITQAFHPFMQKFPGAWTETRRILLLRIANISLFT
jgi:hypothetical protein